MGEAAKKFRSRKQYRSALATKKKRIRRVSIELFSQETVSLLLIPCAITFFSSRLTRMCLQHARITHVRALDFRDLEEEFWQVLCE